MRTRIISLLFSACSFVLGALSSYAQSGKITYTGEKVEKASPYYIQNVSTGNFILEPKVVESLSLDAKVYNVRPVNAQLMISGFTYDSSKPVYVISSSGSNGWSYSYDQSTGGYVLYATSVINNRTNYYQLDANADLKRLGALNETDPVYKWKMVSRDQVEAVEPNKIANRLSSQLGYTVTAKWQSDILTGKEGNAWGAYLGNATGICLNLGISGLKAGKYAIEFSGKSNLEKKAQVHVESLKGDQIINSCFKSLERVAKTYVIPIEVVSDGASLNVYVDTELSKQNIWGIISGIRCIDDAEYKSLMTTWSPEVPKTSVEYYMFNQKTQYFLGAVNKTYRNIVDATRFKMSGTVSTTGVDNAIISYNGGYLNDDDKWTSNSAKWDVKKASTNFGTNCYTIQKDGATNVLRCDGANNVTYPDEAANDNNVWQFISKEQYHAVYPTERIRQMLGQNSVVVERDFSSPFDVKKLSGNSSWFVTQNKVGVNNKYTITSLKNDSYIVEVYASKVGGNEASIVVNDQSMALSNSIESYTFNVKVEDGKIELYEESAQGAGELSLAIKSIALEKDYVNQFISVFRGEKVENNRSYYINSIGGGNYVTSYRTSTKYIYDATPFVFSQDNSEYRIASGQNYIGHDYESLTGNMSNWKLSTPVNSDYGYHYEIYHYWWDHNVFHSNYGSNYCFWTNASNSALSTETFSTDDTHTAQKFHFRMISKEQYAVMFPQASIRQSLYNDNIAVTRENVESGLSMDNTKGTWLVKQTVTKAGDYIKITINNLVDDKYEIEMYGAMAGQSSSEVRFVAHTGSDIIEWDDELSSELKSYKKTVEVKGGTLILYVKASEGVSAVYSAINSIKLFSETLDQDANSKIEWANETLKAGSFRLQNLRTKGFLVAPGSNGMQLNTANSTLFNITGSKTYISYDNDGVVNYAYQADGDGYWGVNPLYWTFVSQTGGYNIYSDNEKNWSRDRYIQYNEYGYLSYPRQSDNHYTNDRVWKLISQEQYEALAPIEIAKRYMSLGTGVRVSWEQSIIAEKVGDIWTAKSNPDKSGDYNMIEITGIADGWYDVQMYANMNEGNSGKIVAKSNNHEAFRTVCGSELYSYSLPVKVSGGTLQIYITVDGGWGSVCTAIKNIVPFKADKGVVDSYVKNAYFTIPQGNRDWDNNWTNVGFEPAIGSSETGLSGYAFHPEVKVKSNYLQKYTEIKGDVKISQNIELSRGTYVLSADAFTKGFNGVLYAKVGDKEYNVSCAGELANYKVEFDVNTETEVEIGFKKGEKWQDGETVLAVDNFRLSFSDDYLKNPDFSDDDNYWDYEGMVYSSGHEGNMNVDRYLKSKNTQWNMVPVGNIHQKVTLPAGAYRFSASVFANNIMPRLYATVRSGSDARTQKTYIAHTGYNNGKEGQFYKEMVFVVPTACDVVVGLSFDATEYTSNVDVAVDNFHLVRLGDAENTEISCQIVNNAFTLGKNDALNKTYGWEAKTPGFREYGSNVASVRYEGETSAWKNYSISQIVSGLPNGWYRIEAQGLYRDNSDATSAKALMFANGSYTDIPLYSGSVSDALSTVSSAFANNPNMYMCDLVVHVDDGNIELGVKREDDNGKITINADLTALNFVKLYYLYEENVFADVTYFIKNPSFETGNTLKWKLGNLDNVKATKTTDSRWDKSYYYGASSTKSGLKSLRQTIEGLPAGEYEISVQVQAVTSGTKVSLYGNVGDELTNDIASSTSTGVVTISGRVEIQEGDNLTIGVGSTGNFNVDNFVLSKSSADVYLYNVEAGAFFGKQIESGYSVIDKDWGKPVGFDSEGTLIRMTKSDDEITFKNMSGEYLEVKRLYGSTEDFKYTFYNDKPNDDTHHRFRMNQIDNSNFCNFSVEPTDGKFGTKSPVENVGAARQYHGTYGITYLGWSGEDGFDVLLPLIPRTDSLYRGVTWQVLTQKQYETYGATIKAAHAARMAAWPILCSARRSKLQVDYTQFEHVYNNIASTAEEISAYATTVQNKLLSGNTLNAATEQNYVDLTFLMEDADCKQKNITWNNAEGVFKSSETSEYTSEKAFSGRRYTAFDTEKLADTEFTCELNGLPYGRYMISLTGSAYANNNEVKNAYFFARNNYGDVEKLMGTAAYSIQNIVTPKFSVDANNPSVTIGVKLYNTNAKYVSIDDIRILYLGDTNSDVYNYGYISENGVLKLLGAWPEEPEAENYMKYVLGSNSGVSAIVLNAPGFSSDFDVEIDCSKYTNKNLLVYKDSDPATSKISVINKTTNFVEDGKCQNLVLVDKYDIAVPSAFTAKKASYSRAVTTNYGTLCLPFEYSADEGNVKLFKFADFENNNGVFRIGLEETTDIAAGKPCIFKRSDSDVKTININVNRNVDVVVAAGVAKNSQGYELRGSYKAVTFGDTSGKDKTAANDYYYIAKDKFWHATDYFGIGAFRAYIYAGDKRITDLNINEARSFVLYEISFDEDQEETTAVDDIDDDVTIVGYYNANGQQIEKPTSGIVIVKYSDGKSRKIIVKE